MNARKPNVRETGLPVLVEVSHPEILPLFRSEFRPKLLLGYACPVSTAPLQMLCAGHPRGQEEP